MQFIEGLAPDERVKSFPPGTLNRDIRDVLAHLHHWHLMMLEWYRVGQAGGKPLIPGKGYTWKSLPQLNRWIWEKYHQTELEDVMALFEKSHAEITELIESLSEEDLYAKKRFSWTGSTSLGVYLRAATSSHYAWGLKLIKKANK